MRYLRDSGAERTMCAREHGPSTYHHDRVFSDTIADNPRLGPRLLESPCWGPASVLS